MPTVKRILFRLIWIEMLIQMCKYSNCQNSVKIIKNQTNKFLWKSVNFGDVILLCLTLVTSFLTSFFDGVIFCFQASPQTKKGLEGIGLWNRYSSSSTRKVYALNFGQASVVFTPFHRSNAVYRDFVTLCVCDNDARFWRWSPGNESENNNILKIFVKLNVPQQKGKSILTKYSKEILRYVCRRRCRPSWFSCTYTWK